MRDEPPIETGEGVGDLPNTYLSESLIKEETARTTFFLLQLAEFIDNASVNYNGDVFLNPNFELEHLKHRYPTGSALRALDNWEYRKASKSLAMSLDRFSAKDLPKILETQDAAPQVRLVQSVRPIVRGYLECTSARQLAGPRFEGLVLAFIEVAGIRGVLARERRIEIAFRVVDDSAVPLALEKQVVLGGGCIELDELGRHKDALVALTLDDRSSIFKRVGAALPGELAHLRQFESIGGLGSSQVLSVGIPHKGIRNVTNARTIIGVLYHG
jgi:hypothetical protein